MKQWMLVVALICLAIPTNAAYFHAGFNQVSSGIFFPIAGAEDEQQAGFITPVIEHDAKDGYLIIPGISYNLINLGYIGSSDNARGFLHGKAAIGPSLQIGDLVKQGLRMICNKALPGWRGPGRYGALKALLSPGQEGLYADIGVYQAIPLNQFGAWKNIKPETMIGATLVKKF